MAKAHVVTMPTIQLSLNIRKCIFLTPIGILLGHIVCKEGTKVDFSKIQNYPRLKSTGEPKTSQGTTWLDRILQEIHKLLFRYGLSIGRTIKRRSRVRLDRGMQHII